MSLVSMSCCRTPETLLISTEAIAQRMKAMFLKLGCPRMRILFDRMRMAAIKLLSGKYLDQIELQNTEKYTYSGGDGFLDSQLRGMRARHGQTMLHIQIEPGKPWAEVSNRKQTIRQKKSVYRMWASLPASAMPKPRLLCAPVFGVPSGGVFVVAGCVSVVCRWW